MKRTADVFLILAALDLTKSELASIAREVRARTDNELYEFVGNLRSMLPRTILPDGSQAVRVPGNALDRYDFSIGSRVSRLLRDEAGLTTGDSIQELTHQLIEHKLLALDEIPHANRRAFSDWVERIAKVVAHKDLLQVATLIRNRFVHSPPADWDLSRSKK